MSSSHSSSFAAGMLLGAAVGSVAGLLMAPRTGKETRALLKKSTEALPELAEDLTTSLQFHAHRLSDSAMVRWNDTLVRLQDAIEAGADAAKHQRQRLEIPQDSGSSE